MGARHGQISRGPRRHFCRTLRHALAGAGGRVFTGASIPGFLWLAIGSPLTGLFQDATLFHDYYCSLRNQPAAAVHTMFYEALLASGVAAWTAGKFYYGVKLGGPSWDELQVANARLATVPSARGFRMVYPSPPGAARRPSLGFRPPPSATTPPSAIAPPPGGSAGRTGSAVSGYPCTFAGHCGAGSLSLGTGGDRALAEARIVVDRNQAAAIQFAKCAPGIRAGRYDLAQLDAAAATARGAIERSGWSAADQLAWEMAGVGAPQPPQ